MRFCQDSTNMAPFERGGLSLPIVLLKYGNYVQFKRPQSQISHPPLIVCLQGPYYGFLYYFQIIGRSQWGSSLPLVPPHLNAFHFDTMENYYRDSSRLFKSFLEFP